MAQNADVWVLPKLFIPGERLSADEMQDIADQLTWLRNRSRVSLAHSTSSYSTQSLTFVDVDPILLRLELSVPLTDFQHRTFPYSEQRFSDVFISVDGTGIINSTGVMGALDIVRTDRNGQNTVYPSNGAVGTRTAANPANFQVYSSTERRNFMWQFFDRNVPAGDYIYTLQYRIDNAANIFTLTNVEFILEVI